MMPTPELPNRPIGAPVWPASQNASAGRVIAAVGGGQILARGSLEDSDCRPASGDPVNELRQIRADSLTAANRQSPVGFGHPLMTADIGDLADVRAPVKRIPDRALAQVLGKRIVRAQKEA